MREKVPAATANMPIWLPAKCPGLSFTVPCAFSKRMFKLMHRQNMREIPQCGCLPVSVFGFSDCLRLSPVPHHSGRTFRFMPGRFMMAHGDVRAAASSKHQGSNFIKQDHSQHVDHGGDQGVRHNRRIHSKASKQQWQQRPGRRAQRNHCDDGCGNHQ